MYLTVAKKKKKSDRRYRISNRPSDENKRKQKVGKMQGPYPGARGNEKDGC